MKKDSKRKAPQKFKKTPLKSYKKTFSLLIIVSLILLAGLILGILFRDKIGDNKQKIIPSSVTVKTPPLEMIKTYEEKTEDLAIQYAQNASPFKNEKEEIIDKDNNNTFHYEEPNLEEIDKNETKVIEDITEKILTPPTVVEVEKSVEKIYEEKKDLAINEVISNKPKLVIIIDDVTTKGQIKRIQQIGYTVNMAFLPPTTGHRNSAKIAKDLDKYMIHLPLQASSSRYEEENTLHINDDISKIETRIKYLRELYPNTNFLNNHTGSKFTSNKEAMDKLFQVLKKYNYTFIDSRTTAKSVAKESSKEFGVTMFSRNIFLDNKKDKKYIQKQLKKAIKIAKKKGMAIAIGHPYSITFETLKDSKYLLKDLDLVYVQNL